MVNRKSLEMAESFARRASNKEMEARENLKKFNIPESISASQECIELSMKAIFLLLTDSYPKKHDFTDDDYVHVLSKVPKQAENLNFARLFILSKFWSNFYSAAKYGNEKFGMGPEKLFKQEEAELALKHAEECNLALRVLQSVI